jgi:hypothetical protein
MQKKNRKSNLTTARLSISILAVLVLMFAAIARVTAAPPPAKASTGAAQAAAKTSTAAAQQKMAKLPLVFEPNAGQTDSQVQFLARSTGYSVFLTGPNKAVFGFPTNGKAEDVLSLNLVGANGSAKPEALEKASGVSNYYVGKDRSKWLEKIPNYAKIRYDGIYPGVNVIYQGDQRKFRYDFEVQPGADPGAIRIAYSGYKGISIDANGNLVVGAANGQLTANKPVIFQEYAGVRHPVEGGYRLDGDQVRFEVGSYDKSHVLVIDPSNTYGTYFGPLNGSGNTQINGVALDATGAVYVTGFTASTGLPGTTGALQGGKDVFIAKFSANLTTEMYSTDIGGPNDDVANGIALSGTSAVIVGTTTSGANYPTMNPVESLSGINVDQHVIVTEVSSTGTMLYSSILSGDGAESGNGIAIDSAGNIDITGTTSSNNFNATTPVLVPKGFQTSNHSTASSTNAFVIQLNPSGQAVNYGTYYGGCETETGNAITADSTNAIYVVGSGNSYNPVCTTTGPSPTAIAVKGGFSVAAGVFAGANPRGLFLKILPGNSGGASWTQGGLFGGPTSTETEMGTGVAVDVLGNAYITGNVTGPTFGFGPAVLSGGIGTGNNVIFSMPFSGGVVSSITQNVGSLGDWTVAPNVSIAAPGLVGGVTAAAAATLSVGNVVLNAETNQGSGYTSIPAITFSGGTCNGQSGITAIGCAYPIWAATVGSIVVGNPTAAGQDGFLLELAAVGSTTPSSNGFTTGANGVKGAGGAALVYATLVNGDEVHGNGTGVLPPNDAVTNVNGVTLDPLGSAYIGGSISSTTELVGGINQSAILRRVAEASGTEGANESAANTPFLLDFGSQVTSGGPAVFPTGDIGMGNVGVSSAIAYVEVTNGGTAYGTVPNVVFTGGCTTEPTGTAQISGGQVISVTLTTNGSGCTSPPAVSFTGGNGSGAAQAFLFGSGSAQGVAFSPSTFGTCIAGVVTQPLPVTTPSSTAILQSSAFQSVYDPSSLFTDGIIACVPMTNFVQLTGIGLGVNNTINMGNIALPSVVIPPNQTIGANVPGALATATISAISYSPGPAVAGPPSGACAANPWLNAPTPSGDTLTLSVNGGNAKCLDPGIYMATFTITPGGTADNAGVPQTVVVTLTVSGQILSNTGFSGGIPASTFAYTVEEGIGFTDGNTVETINIPVVSNVNYILSNSQGNILLSTAGVSNSSATYPVLGTGGVNINLTPGSGLPIGGVGCGNTPGSLGASMAVGTFACYIQLTINSSMFNGAPVGGYTGSFTLAAVSPNSPAGAQVTSTQVPNAAPVLTFTVNVEAGQLVATPSQANFGVPSGFTGLITSVNNVILNTTSMLTTVAGTYTAGYASGTGYCPLGVYGNYTVAPLDPSFVTFSASGPLPPSNALPLATEIYQVGISNTSALSPGFYSGQITITPAGPGVSGANGAPATINVCVQVGVLVTDSYNNLPPPIFIEAGTSQNSTLYVNGSGILLTSTNNTLNQAEFGEGLPLLDPGVGVTLTDNNGGVSWPLTFGTASSAKTPVTQLVTVAPNQTTPATLTVACPSPNGALVTACPTINVTPAGSAIVASSTTNPAPLPVIVTSGVELMYSYTGPNGQPTAPGPVAPPFGEDGATVGEHIAFTCSTVVSAPTSMICTDDVTIIASAGSPSVSYSGPYSNGTALPEVGVSTSGSCEDISPGSPCTVQFCISDHVIGGQTLSAGTYYVSYLLSSAGGGSNPNPPPQFVEVDITVTITPNPVIVSTPPALNFQYNVAAPATTPATVPFVLTANANPAPIGFQVAAAAPLAGGATVLVNGTANTINGCITDANTMVTATYTSGVFSCSNVPLTLSASIVTTGLTVPNSTYNGAVTVNIPTSGGNQVVQNPLFNIPVTVTTHSAPSLTFSPTTVGAFNWTLGQVSASATPASQTSTITLIGTDTYNVTSNVDWITVTPNTGISNATQSITLTVNSAVADFPTTANTYGYTITATGASGEVTTPALTGSLVVFAKPAVTFTPASPDNLQYYAGDPDSTVSPFTVTVAPTPLQPNQPNPTYTLTATTNQAWCTAAIAGGGVVNASGGTMTVTLTPLENALAPNATPYVCTITVAGGTSITTSTFLVNLTVSAQSLNTLNPSTLTFNMPTNATPATATQTVPVTGHGTFTFNTTDAVVSPVGGTWLSSSPVALVNGAGTLTVTTNDTGLAAGNQYGGTIAYIGPPNNSVPFNTTVYLNVGVIGASPSAVIFSHTLNFTTPQPATVSLTSPPASLGFTVVTTPSASWLTCSANTNVTPAVLSVSYNPTGLTAANSPYTGSCTVNTTGSSNTLVVPVTLNVTASPTLSATVGGGNNPVINLTGTLGGPNVTSTITIDAIGLPTGGTIPLTISNVTSNPVWLSVSPTTGVTAGAAGTTLTITVNMAALGANAQPGTLNGYFNVGSGSAANTLTVSVILTTVAPGDPFFNGEISVGGGFFYLVLQDGSPFGFYSFAQGTASTASATIFHADMGFEYVTPAGGAGAGVYMYDFSSGHWWYTASSLFPYIYDFSLNSWLYYFPNTSSAGHYTTAPRYFYNFGTGKIVSF